MQAPLQAHEQAEQQTLIRSDWAEAPLEGGLGTAQNMLDPLTEAAPVRQLVTQQSRPQARFGEEEETGGLIEGCVLLP